MDLIGGLSLEAGVGSGLVVELDIFPQGGSLLLDRVVCLEVPLFVLDRSPDSFHEKNFAPAAFSIHADLDSCPPCQKHLGCKLRQWNRLSVSKQRYARYRKQRLQHHHFLQNSFSLREFDCH